MSLLKLGIDKAEKEWDKARESERKRLIDRAREEQAE